MQLVRSQSIRAHALPPFIAPSTATPHVPSVRTLWFIPLPQSVTDTSRSVPSQHTMAVPEIGPVSC